MPARPRTPVRRPARKRASPRRAVPHALALLRDDHRKAAGLFAQFRKLEGDDARKASVVAALCRELTVHAKVEEEIFYPAARTVLRDAALVDEADVEHATLRALVADLERMKPGDDHYDAKVTVLGEYVRHHVQEEQERLFAALRRTPLDFAVLGERIAARRRELEGALDHPQIVDDAIRRFVPTV
jgi:hypothetical protein